MEYRKFGDSYYIRMDRGDEIMESILAVCASEGVRSATFSGIGGCSDALLQTFVPEQGAFETEELRGALEMVSLLGNVISDTDGNLFYHAHAMFSCRENGAPRVAGGHLKSSTVLYTAEITLRPVVGGSIGWMLNPETGTGFWRLSSQ